MLSVFYIFRNNFWINFITNNIFRLVNIITFIDIINNTLDILCPNFYFLSIKPNRYQDKGRVRISQASKTNQTVSQNLKSLKFEVAKLSVNVLELSSIGPRVKSLQLSTSSSSSQETTFQSDVWFSIHWFVFEPST